MRQTLRNLLATVAVIAGLLSLPALFWWLSHGALFMGLGLSGALSFGGPQAHLLLFQLINGFVISGGFFGWAALFALCVFSSRRLRQLPKWVLVGCGIGTVAAVVLPGGSMFAYFPILLAGSLLLRCWLVAPNNSFKADGSAAA